jgi:hypothetical protein
MPHRRPCFTGEPATETGVTESVRYGIGATVMHFSFAVAASLARARHGRAARVPTTDH